MDEVWVQAAKVSTIAKQRTMMIKLALAAVTVEAVSAVGGNPQFTFLKNFSLRFRVEFVTQARRYYIIKTS